jgi:hypothetical protein
MTIIIGIDPHKATHTAVAIDETEQPLARFELAADRCQTMRLLAWAAPFEDRAWAVESADGLGKLLAQQLVAQGEHVIDVPATLAGPGAAARLDEGIQERPERRPVHGDRWAPSLRAAARRRR